MKLTIPLSNAGLSKNGGVTPLPQMLYTVHSDIVDYTCHGLSRVLVKFREETILFVMFVGLSVLVE
jgi:hypothetical protein